MLLALGGNIRLARGVSLGFFVLAVTLSPFALAQQKLETAQDVNARIQALSGAHRYTTNDYLIGGGDLLKIGVFDVPDLSREVRVTESGYISLPLIPVKIRAAGLTAFQLEEKLAELLQVHGLVSHPQVTVFLAELRSQPITVIGAVRSPKVIQAIRPMTILEVLSDAGGISDDAGAVVLITRSTPHGTESSPADPAAKNDAPLPAQVFTIRLNDLLESGSPEFNVPVYGGDIISVPRAGIVYVAGAVERPGGFVLQSDREEMTALKVIALAQGLRGSAKAGEAVIIRKNPDTGENQEIDVNLGKIMARKTDDVRLYANDILFVPDSAGKKALRRMGEVVLGITSSLVILRGGR